MFELKMGRTSECTGVNRRDLLRVGSLAVLGATLPELLRSQAAAAAAGQPVKEVNCIFLWLAGGQSHLETFDPKPNAPAEIRGQFGVTRAKTGELFGELIPKVASSADLFSIIRTVTHTNNDHDQ